MRRRVLVIEDNLQDRDLLAAYLEAMRYEVQTAEGGGVGLSLATDRVPDVVLLDLHLPDIDGYEVCRLIRQQPGTQRVPVVFLTASDDPALNRHAYAAGAQACLTKPFRQEALIATIEATLAGMARPGRPTEG